METTMHMTFAAISLADNCRKLPVDVRMVRKLNRLVRPGYRLHPVAA